jgi:hypothetical protein
VDGRLGRAIISRGPDPGATRHAYGARGRQSRGIGSGDGVCHTDTTHVGGIRGCRAGPCPLGWIWAPVPHDSGYRQVAETTRICVDRKKEE